MCMNTKYYNIAPAIKNQIYHTPKKIHEGPGFTWVPDPGFSSSLGHIPLTALWNDIGKLSSYSLTYGLEDGDLAYSTSELSDCMWKPYIDLYRTNWLYVIQLYPSRKVTM